MTAIVFQHIHKRCPWHDYWIERARMHAVECHCHLCLKAQIWDATRFDLCVGNLTLEMTTHSVTWAYYLDLEDVPDWNYVLEGQPHLNGKWNRADTGDLWLIAAKMIYGGPEAFDNGPPHVCEFLRLPRCRCQRRMGKLGRDLPIVGAAANNDQELTGSNDDKSELHLLGEEKKV